MRILVTGGTGFIGQALCRKLLERDEDVWIYSRQDRQAVQQKCGRVRAVNNLDCLGTEDFDAVINLAGEPIAARPWTKKRRQLLRESRVDLTQELVRRIGAAQHPPSILISGSATGFYGDGGDLPLTESAEPSDEFTHQLCADWEHAAIAAERHGTRVCLMRIGIVLGEGGFLSPLLPLFKLGLGSRLGSGQQWMSWIALEDMLRVMLFLLDDAGCSGAYNAVSPQPLTNLDFTRRFAAALARPAWLVAPAPVLKLLLGELSRLLLTGQRALPQRLLDAGFSFKHPQLESALEAAGI